MNRCHYCGPTERELRPYGPGGSKVCLPCMMETPERKAELKANFAALLTANEAISLSGATLLTDDGPVPFDPSDYGLPS